MEIIFKFKYHLVKSDNRKPVKIAIQMMFISIIEI